MEGSIQKFYPKKRQKKEFNKSKDNTKMEKFNRYRNKNKKNKKIITAKTYSKIQIIKT